MPVRGGVEGGCACSAADIAGRAQQQLSEFIAVGKAQVEKDDEGIDWYQRQGNGLLQAQRDRMAEAQQTLQDKQCSSPNVPRQGP